MRLPRKLGQADREVAATLRLPVLIVSVASAVFGLPGCMAHLAPDSDPSIVDDLASANRQAMTPFESVAAGTAAASPYSSRVASCNSVIGAATRIALPRPF